MLRSVYFVLCLGGILGLAACGDDDNGQNNNNVPPVCGNALIEQGEVCDGVNVGLQTCSTQGFASGTLACNGTCTAFDTSACIPDPANCGNDTIDYPETCDGNDLNGQTCASVGNYTGGVLACNATCSGWNTTGCINDNAVCGNHLAESSETCDGTDLKNQDCTTISGGFTGGTLACNATCDGWNTTGCNTDPVCGDDVAEGSEVCDGADLRSQDCTTISGGFTAGILACNATCDDWDTSHCWARPVNCGNGVIDSGEVCDGTNLNQTGCTDLGYSGGRLLCTGDCSAFVEAGCFNSAAVCGDGRVELGEACDGVNLQDLTCSDLGFTGGTLACRSDCTFDLSGCTGNFCANVEWDTDSWCDVCHLYGGPVDPACYTACFQADGTCNSWYDPFSGGSACMIAVGVEDPDCGTCGDGTLDSDFEQCDQTDVGSSTCETLGFAPGGSLGCDNNCVLQTSGCSATTCGDGQVEGFEQCEGTSVGSETCQTQGYPAGTLGCDDQTCRFDTTSCLPRYVFDSTATFSWVDISASGDASYLLDDDYAGPLALGFDFPMAGQTHAQVYASSNGLLTFLAGETEFENECPLPSTYVTDPAIAVMWDDLDPETTSDPLYYQAFGSCPVGSGSCFVVTWQGYHLYSSGSLAGTFQAILFDNGSVLLQFQDGGADEGLESTTGLQWSGDGGQTYRCDTANSLTDGLAVCIVYPGSGGCS